MVQSWLEQSGVAVPLGCPLASHPEGAEHLTEPGALGKGPPSTTGRHIHAAAQSDTPLDSRVISDLAF